ncbi:AP-1 complex subunit gamma-1 [Angomonas deanei]|nr:AP-1 complex subunit gamma-1 [Angomonas deanei]|eukprot:EPY37324.1 AP-1 complex subunit gamma-1 [Angomonas deanei]
MRIIGQGSAVTSEALNDVLAQVITNTDASRNVGCAIHYECVRTINTIESDDGLRLLAVNTISRFLSSSRDNNLRVVALKTLLDYAHTYGDLDTVQQHRETIIECMRDPDVSIRRRALELTVALVTEDNVRLMVPDLLQYLTLCSNDMREETTTHICRIIEEKSPGDEWRVELSLKVLKVSKQHAKVDFAKRLVGILSQQKEDVQATSVKFLWDEASFPFDAIHHARKAFMVAALWSIGEYCDLLTTKYKVTPQEVVTCLVDITNNTPFPLLKQYGLTAMMKTATKFPAVAKSALSAMSSHLSSLDCELQQRASEYATLLKDFPEDAKFCFAKMPPICPAPEEEAKPVQVVSVSPDALQKQTATALDDLFGFDGPKPDSIVSQTQAEKAAAGGATLDDIFGDAPNNKSAPSPVSSPTHVDPFADVPAEPTPGKKVFECPDFSVFLTYEQRESVFDTQIKVLNTLDSEISQISIQIAAARQCVLNVAPQSLSSLSPHATLVQQLELDTTNGEKNKGVLLLRVKFMYSVNGQAREQLFQISA